MLWYSHSCRLAGSMTPANACCSNTWNLCVISYKILVGRIVFTGGYQNFFAPVFENKIFDCVDLQVPTWADTTYRTCGFQIACIFLVAFPWYGSRTWVGASIGDPVEVRVTTWLRNINPIE